MAIINLDTDVGRIKMRLGDFLDIQNLPDSVYTQALLDTINNDGSNNLRSATLLCGQYILASLSFNTHQKMGVLEVYGAEAFSNYQKFLLMIIKDPAFNGVCPLPYVAGADILHPILQHQIDFKGAFTKPTSDERLHSIASGQFDPYSGNFLN